MKNRPDPVRTRLLALADERDLAVTVADIEVLADAAVGAFMTELVVQTPDSPVTLTGEQTVVLIGLALGDTEPLTARRMGITRFAVKARRKTVYRALGAKTGAEAVAIAMSLGLIQPGLRTNPFPLPGQSDRNAA